MTTIIVKTCSDCPYYTAGHTLTTCRHKDFAGLNGTGYAPPSETPRAVVGNGKPPADKCPLVRQGGINLTVLPVSG